MSSANIIDPRQLAAMAHEDLACYSIAQWPQFERAPHHELIISRLEAIERGEIKRLMIFQPPRHGKSVITSSLYPPWYLGRNPNRHVIFASYGQELSDDFGRHVRNYINDPLHQAIFPNCRLSEDSTAAQPPAVARRANEVTFTATARIATRLGVLDLDRERECRGEVMSSLPSKRSRSPFHYTS
jgi:hypothetical protein